nr:ester cyclase [Kibdelosporangium sp. MJ126-NF4]CEL14729.1 hypothetical protein [Kibdelosporangium sp. MJ126-NF4]CTQ96641.1 hypothetical protein [Kibdelosporangium sp. MJ126-NF4]
MTPAEMDAVFERHIAAEMAHDIPGILDTLTDDVEHDVIGHPMGVLRNHADIAKRYEEQFTAITDDAIEPIRRNYGENLFIDESIVSGRVRGTYMGIPGNNRLIRIRMLHVCEVRDGKMSRENVWADMASLLAQLGQLGATPEPRG